MGVLLYSFPISGYVDTRLWIGQFYFGDSCRAPITVPVGVEIMVEVDFTLTVDAGVTGGTISLVAYDENDYVIESVLLEAFVGFQITRSRKMVQFSVSAARAEWIHCFAITLSDYAGQGIVRMENDSVVRVRAFGPACLQTSHRLCDDDLDCER